MQKLFHPQFPAPNVINSPELIRDLIARYDNEEHPSTRYMHVSGRQGVLEKEKYLNYIFDITMSLYYLLV